WGAERRTPRAQQDPDRGLLEGLEAVQQDQRPFRPRTLVHELGRVPRHLPGRGLALATRLQPGRSPDDPVARPIDGPRPCRGRPQGELRRGGREDPSPGDVRVLRGRALLQVQRMETHLDDPHAVRTAPRPRERGRPPPTLRGPCPHMVRKPPATEPRCPHQVPEADVREDRDLQSVTRPRSSDARDNRRRAYITATREFSPTWKTCCPALSSCFWSAARSSLGPTGESGRGTCRRWSVRPGLARIVESRARPNWAS